MIFWDDDGMMMMMKMKMTMMLSANVLRICLSQNKGNRLTLWWRRCQDSLILTLSCGY